MRRARALACVVLMMIGLLRGTASAQQGDPTTPALAHRVGPLYLSPRLTLRDVGVDSNVYNKSNVDQPISDLTFTVTPSVEARAAVRRATFTLRSGTDFVYFAQQHSERSINQDLFATGRYALRRLSVFAEAGYLNTRQRPDDEIDARSRRIDRRGALGVGIALSPKFSAQVRGDHTRMAFDADAIFDGTWLAQELNREVRTVSGSFRYAATPLTAVVVISDVGRTRFTQDTIRDADSRQTLLGVELAPRALISGSARVGYQRFRPRSAAVPDFDGLVGSGGLSYRFRDSTTFGLSFDRYVAYSYSQQEPYYVRQTYGISMHRRLVQRWDLEVRGGRSRHQYRQLAVAPVAETVLGRSERFLDAGAMIGYEPRPGTRFTVGLSYYDRRSDQDYRTYDSLRLGTSVVFGF